MSKIKYPLSWLPAIIIMIVIFSFSAKAAGDSSRTSSGITDKIVKIIEIVTGDEITPDGSQYEKIHVFIRKCGHFSEYMALGCTLVLPYAMFIDKRWMIFLLCQLSSTFYACTDEFHQIFVAGRDGNFIDVGIDSAGAFVGICIGFVMWYIIKFRKREGKVCTII